MFFKPESHAEAEAIKLLMVDIKMGNDLILPSAEAIEKFVNVPGWRPDAEPSHTVQADNKKSVG